MVGLYIGIFLFIPFTYEFFIGFKLEVPHSPLSLNLFTKIDEYISYFFSSLFSFLLLFQTPLLLLFFLDKKIITYNYLISSRKYSFILSLLFFSFLTPPDIISLFLFAVPFFFIYEFLIFFLLLYKEYSL